MWTEVIVKTEQSKEKEVEEDRKYSNNLHGFYPKYYRFTSNNAKAFIVIAQSTSSKN